MAFLPPVPGSGDAGQQLHPNGQHFLEDPNDSRTSTITRAIKMINNAMVHLDMRMHLMAALVEMATFSGQDSTSSSNNIQTNESETTTNINSDSDTETQCKQ